MESLEKIKNQNDYAESLASNKNLGDNNVNSLIFVKQNLNTLKIKIGGDDTLTEEEKTEYISEINSELSRLAGRITDELLS